MRFSSSHAVLVITAVALAGFAGCSSEAESLFGRTLPNANSGGAGGKGGDSGLGGAGGQGGTAETSSSSSSSSSSGMVDPQKCGTCSFQACQTEIFACGQKCQGFLSCIQACTDSTCANDCETKYPEGKPIYDCSCSSCTTDCGGLCPSGSGSGSSSASGSSSGATCSTCSQLLQGKLGQPCPGSDQLIFALYGCACQQNCTMQCGTLCQGQGQPSTTCVACAAQFCGAELQACIQN
jgi:hypothetical protein